MKSLNTSVHHEMIGPLRAQRSISKTLQRLCTSLRSKKLAKLIEISSKMLLLHTQDLLDQRIIENGGFMPAYSVECIHKTIIEIISLVKLTITKNVEIVLGNKI